MTYKYITENNLDNKQTYMYSEYEGIELIHEYLATRQNFIKEYSHGRPVLPQDFFGSDPESGLQEPRESDTEMRLSGLYDALLSEGITKNNKELTDCFVKSFEVRKRLYAKYEWDRWKPIEGAGYKDTMAYFLFSNILCFMYRNTKCLKYLSCMLKVDDTLLSIEATMDYRQKCILSELLKLETEYVIAVGTQAGIELK